MDHEKNVEEAREIVQKMATALKWTRNMRAETNKYQNIDLNLSKLKKFTKRINKDIFK